MTRWIVLAEQYRWAGTFEQIEEGGDDFEFGLQCVLDGIEALVARGASR